MAGREPPPAWRQRTGIVAMDGFAGCKTAPNEQLPAARAVMDPFHVVSLAGQALDETRHRSPGRPPPGGAGGPRTPCTRRAGRCAPATACPPAASGQDRRSCSPTSATPPSR